MLGEMVEGGRRSKLTKVGSLNQYIECDFP